MNDTTLPITNNTKKANPRQRSNGNGGRVKKGFGLHDWMTLLRHAKDLAQRKGAPIRKDITLSEVQQHSKPYDGWIILRGKVYNITPYLSYHPGGSAIIESCLGKDATSLFDKYHSWVNIDNLVGALLIGYLMVEKPRMAKINDDDDDDDDDDLEDDSRDTILPIATSSAKTSIRSSTNDSNNIEFAMPKPRPPKGKPIGSLLPKDDDDEEEGDEDAFIKL